MSVCVCVCVHWRSGRLLGVFEEDKCLIGGREGLYIKGGGRDGGNDCMIHGERNIRIVTITRPLN